MIIESVSRHRTIGVLAYVGSISEREVSKYVQELTVLYLQQIGTLLRDNRCCIYYLSFDGATNHIVSYIDVRVRFCASYQIANVHLLANPIRVIRTGEKMNNVADRLIFVVVGVD